MYLVRGFRLNGLSQAVSYGDDAQAATNYPLIRLEDPCRKDGLRIIYYCRTFDHSTMGVAASGPNAVRVTHSTHFKVPDRVPAGHYDLVVVANGIPSRSAAVSVTSC